MTSVESDSTICPICAAFRPILTGSLLLECDHDRVLIYASILLCRHSRGCELDRVRKVVIEIPLTPTDPRRILRSQDGYQT